MKIGKLLLYTTHSREMARDWAEKVSGVNPVLI